MREDLRNQRFGHLLVIDFAEDEITKNGRHIARWKCLCDCGAIVITRASSLKSGHTKGCGQKHRKIKDMTGLRFHKLLVLKRANDYIRKNGTRDICWLCRCDCGREVVVRGTNLRYGTSKSCGICSRSQSNMGKHQKDLTGLKFGRWTVLYENGRLLEPRGRIVPLWHCRCDCGVERDIRAGTLVSGLSLSCGCYKYDKLVNNAKKGFKQSKAEKCVDEYLKENNYYYETQAIYSDLRGDSGYPLSYDFLLYIDNDPKLLIECQGKQHYEPIEYFGGVKQFKVQQDNDEKKRNYAKQHNIDLLEIPYIYNTKKDIIQILEDNIKGFI